MNKRWVIAIAVFISAVLVPIGGLVLMLLQAPPPYVFVSEPGPEWRDGQAVGTDGRAMVRTMTSNAAARNAAQRTLDSISTSFSSSSPGMHRYRVSGSGERGLLLALDHYVVLVSAADKDALERAVVALPFLASNPERSDFVRALNERPMALVAGILGYTLLLVLLASRLSAWAARKQAASNVAGMGEAALRQHLLALEFPDMTARVRDDGDLVFERADVSVSTWTRLRLDPDARVVRAVSGGSARWGRTGWRTIFVTHWWRNMPSGTHSKRMAQTVLESGWTWQPVFTFIKLIGG